MRFNHFRWAFAALACGGLAASSAADLTGKPGGAPGKPAPTEPTCGSHGTSVEFLATPSEAAKQAKTEQKLVFVLHVSGHFETPEFT